MLNNPLRSLPTSYNKAQGFTLIEMVVGMVVLAMALPIVATLLFPAMEQSIKQIRQMRAAELGQSLMNQIVAKAFDENSNRAGGEIRCGENNIDCSTILGSDGNETFDNYDDVDDYDGVVHRPTQYDTTSGELYSGFTLSITVCNDSNYDGVCSGNTAIDNIETAKLISILVTGSSDIKLKFSTYRSNY
jgi:MSHA pilin protein MshD